MTKFRFFRQHDSMECGVAALTMVCNAMGRRTSMKEVAEFCHATKEGVSIKGVSDAARELGLETKVGKLSIENLKKAPLPAILYWNQNHYVVLYKITNKGKTFHIADPAKGKLKLSTEDLEYHWSNIDTEAGKKGIGAFFKPTSNFFQYNTSETHGRKTWSFILGYLKTYRHYFFQIGLGMGIGILFLLLIPLLTQAIVDKGIHNSNLGLIWLILIGELMIVIGQSATDFIRRWIVLHVSMRINISMLSDFFMKLLRLPMRYFDTKLTGDLIQRMGDHNRIQNFLTTQSLSIVFATVTFLVFGVVLCVYSRLIFLIFLGGAILYILWITRFLKRRKILDYEIFEQQSINTNLTYQLMTTVPEIKLQDCEQRRRWEWEDKQADLFDVQMKGLRLQQNQEAGVILINEIKNILITITAASAVVAGDLTLGGMMAIQYIVGQLNAPMQQIIGFAYAIQDVQISLDRINDIHETKEESASWGTRSSIPSGQDIVIEGLNFKYDVHSPYYILKDINTRIERGKVTAIVGASGSGKTTLMKILLGYYIPEAGTIKIGDDNLQDFSVDKWRRHCGAVMQEGVIFSESITRNIACHDGEVDEERMLNASRMACVDEFVQKLPLKYDTKVGADGHGLSLGQKQRILIARAMYRDPDFIFLDEATNSLDSRNEEDIVNNLNKFFKGRTAVIIAHRLSTVRNADHIIVLDSGRIVEEGTHDELLSLGGTYCQLVSRQIEVAP